MDPLGRETLPYLQDLVGELAELHDVEVFALRPAPDPPSFELRGVLVHNVGGLAGGRALAGLLFRHRRRRFDVLHAFWVVPPGAVAALAGTLLRRPVVVHVAGGELVRLPDLGYGGWGTLRGRVAVRRTLRAADAVTVATPAMREIAAERGFRASLVPLGVDLRRWPPRAPARRPDGESIRLLHVGSINRVKDHGTLLEAARILEGRGMPYRLDLVGTDTLGGALQRRARELALPEDRVRFHGFLEQERLRPLVEAAHLLVVSSRHEAGPVALLEAAAAGVPTVGTAVGHVSEWAPDAAVAVPVADPLALAEAVAVLARDEDRRLALAGAAHERALGTDVVRTARLFSELYEELSRPT
jgi:glycosyltransferase involved in cell wall biosynthesis